jgi:hypothetical protein
MARGWKDSRTSAEIHAEKRVTFGAIEVPIAGTWLALVTGFRFPQLSDPEHPPCDT